MFSTLTTGSTSLPVHRRFHLLPASQTDQHTGKGIRYCHINQLSHREKCRQQSRCIHFVEQKSFFCKQWFFFDPVQHSPLQQIAAAL